MDLEKYQTLMEPVSVLGLPEDVSEFLSDQGVCTVMDLLDQELAYYPAEIADLLRGKLEEAGLVESFEPELEQQVDPTDEGPIDLDTLWQAVTEDWKAHVDPSTIIDGLGLAPHDRLDAQNVAALVRRVAQLKPRSLQVYGDAELWVQALAGMVGMAGMAGMAAKNTRALILDTPWEDLSTQVLSCHGDLTPCIEAMPGLELLFCVGTFHLGAMDHDHLKRMYLLSEPLTIDTVMGVCRSRLASLETLALAFGAEGEADCAATAALYKGLGSARWPKLRTLCLENVPSSEIALDRILGSPLAAQLETIQLCDEFTDEDEALAVIESHADVFGKTELIAPFDTFSEDGLRRLRRVIRGADPGATVESMFGPQTYAQYPGGKK